MQDNKFGLASVLTLSAFVLVPFLLFAVPQYNVWTQGLNGKAELQKAEYTRQVAVLEAQAKLDSASKLAESEIERAKGVAKANQIIGDSLKDNPRYLQYLYVTGLQEGSDKGNRTIYVPTEGGMPVPVMDVSK